MSNQAMKTIIIDQEEKKKELPSYMTSYKIFVRNISVSQIAQSIHGTTNPYVTVRLKGGQKYAMTKSQENAHDANYDEILQLDGQCVGSDVLNLLVYNQNGEQNPDKDECLGVQNLVISSLELGLIKEYDLKLYKTIDGTTKKDYDTKLGVAGVLHIEMQVAKLGTLQFQSNPWPPRIFYTLWIHVDRCKNVSVGSKTAQINPFIIARISPCLNSQKQTTPICFNSPNPIWNILQCFHIDNFEKQTVHVTLMNYEEGSTPKKISSIKIPIKLARTDGKPFSSQMLFPLPDRNAKSCTFQFKLQLLEPHSIPFDGMVSMKHQKLQLKLVLYDLINLPASDTPKSVYCVVSCGKINKKSIEVQNTNPAEINQEITIHSITQSQLVLISVIIDNQLYGQTPIHLNNYLLKTKTEANYFSLFKKSSAAVKYDLVMVPEEPEFEDKEEISDQVDEGINLTIPPDIYKYKNNYDKSSASSSAASSANASAASSPQKEKNESGGSDRIKNLIQQAKSGGMTKSVESTSSSSVKVSSTVDNSQSEARAAKINKVQQLASQINNTKQTEVSQQPAQEQVDNRANLVKKYLNQISSNQKTVESTTVQTSSTQKTQEQTVESAEEDQPKSTQDKIKSIKILVDQIKDGDDSSSSSKSSSREQPSTSTVENKPLIPRARTSSQSIKKPLSRRLSAIINSNHNITTPTESELDDETLSRDLSDTSEQSSSNSSQDQSKRRRYNSIHLRQLSLGANDLVDNLLDDNDTDVNNNDDNNNNQPEKVKPAEQRPPPVQRASIAQKYLEQVNNQKATKTQETVGQQSTQDENKVNRVKQLASRINNVTNQQAQSKIPEIVKSRRSTITARDIKSDVNADANGLIQEHSKIRRSSVSDTAALKEFHNMQSQQNSNAPKEGENQQQQVEQEKPQPHVDNRANLAQKFLSQINSQQSSSVQTKQVVTQSQTKTQSQSQSQSTESQSTETKINRVKQLASQINNVTSGQKEGAEQGQTPQRMRRATEAARSIASVPNFDNEKQRRSSLSDANVAQSAEPSPRNEEKINRVKQLASQINSVTSGQIESIDQNQTPTKMRRATEANKDISSVPDFSNNEKRRSSLSDASSSQQGDSSPSNEEKINRVKQLASQINSVTSGQIESIDQNKTPTKMRRATEAAKNISSVPDFSSNEKRRSSLSDASSSQQGDSSPSNEEKINRVKQLASQINSVTSGQTSAVTTPAKATPSNQTQIQLNNSLETSQASITSVTKTSSTKSVQSTTSSTTSMTTTKTSSTSSTTKTVQSSVVASSSSSKTEQSQSLTQKVDSTEVKNRDIQFLDVEHSGDICMFNWGNNDSAYSSSFTGYSECSRSLGSTNSSTAERIHGHRHEDDDPNYQVKPEWHQKVFGKFISAKNLPIKTGKIFATLQLRGLGGLKHFKFTTDEVDPNNLMFNKNINFDRVKKGDSIEIILYTKNGDEDQIPFASAKISCRNLKENSDEMYNVKLEKPSLLLYDGQKLNDIKDFGEVQMSLNTNIEFTVLE